MAINIISRQIVLDVYKHERTDPVTINAIAADNDTRYVAAEIQYDGARYDVGSSAVVELIALRPDKVGVGVTGSTYAFTEEIPGSYNPETDEFTPGETVTYYGVYAELDQAVLAKKGKVLGQFKITSGDQVLHTEVFVVNTGRALDAETSEWAGEYQGYNLDELVQSVNSAMTTVFNAVIPTAWSEGSGISTASITVGKYRKLDANTLTVDSKYAVSSSLNANNRKAVAFTNTNYEFSVIAYRTSTASSANMIGGYGWFPANTVVVLPPEAVIFVYQVKKATSIDSSEVDAIKNGLKTYVPTDSTLSESGKSADAKATGDALDALRLIPARTVLAIGDSICSGGRNDGKGFVGDLGLEYVNAGVSGATISTIRDNTTHWIENQLTAQTDVFDAVIMQGGINDYIYDATLGTMSTVPVRKEDSAYSALNTATVIGALEHLFATCINKYPNADRFFLISHKTREYAWTAGEGGWTQDQFHDAVVACCRLYNVGVIDVYAESPIDTHYTEYVSPTEWSNDHSVGNTEWIDNDRVHPLEYGYLHGYIPLIRKALIATSSKT